MPDMGGLASKSPILAAFFVAATMASIGLPVSPIFWVSSRSSMLSGPNQAGLCLAALRILISAIYGLRAALASFW